MKQFNPNSGSGGASIQQKIIVNNTGNQISSQEQTNVRRSVKLCFFLSSKGGVGKTSSSYLYSLFLEKKWKDGFLKSKTRPFKVINIDGNVVIADIAKRYNYLLSGGENESETDNQNVSFSCRKLTENSSSQIVFRDFFFNIIKEEIDNNKSVQYFIFDLGQSETSEFLKLFSLDYSSSDLVGFSKEFENTDVAIDFNMVVNFLNFADCVSCVKSVFDTFKDINLKNEKFSFNIFLNGKDFNDYPIENLLKSEKYSSFKNHILTPYKDVIKKVFVCGQISPATNASTLIEKYINTGKPLESYTTDFAVRSRINYILENLEKPLVLNF